MAKDYKQTQSSDDESNSGNYTWMMTGIALGLLIGLGMYFYSNKSDPAPTPEQTTPKKQQGPDPISVVIENARREQQEEQRASFSYYAVLPNLELDVDVIPAESDAPKPKPVELRTGAYLLQLASFRTLKQANIAQTRLVADGLSTSIEEKTVNNKTWFRVYMGPTDSQQQIAEWQSKAKQQGLKPLIVKAP
ncbi:MAG: Unknown protein [uncultured Thiotrichaceae bacterium]|uniref:SPOR domain-containing protein n=1 Tax=uncultured Thiotrichaceae bacterium TaxID=298394 RepID=A0A6S6SU79_9GAMM|nr:MAG: Unknown protein [uncultured Thiotrichaceae bacterium]